VIRVTLPHHLRNLAQVRHDIELDLSGDVTQADLIDALEAIYPALRGTIRDPATMRRRPFIRFFAAGEDLSHEAVDARLPPDVVSGREAFHVVGAMAGG
jgi:molybdopterin synthase sulfur carrier subunit